MEDDAIAEAFNSAFEIGDGPGLADLVEIGLAEVAVGQILRKRVIGGDMKWTRAAGPLEAVCRLEIRPLVAPFYHAARGCVCFCGCGHVGNADALSILSTAPLLATASRQTAIGARCASAWCGRCSL